MFRLALSVIVALFLIFFSASNFTCTNAQGYSRVSRCMSICRRNEESLCQRCLFREPMRFGRAGSAAFREPMRFGKRLSVNSATFREMMRFGKRSKIGSAAFREPMRFGKRTSTINNGTENRVMNIADWILEQQQDSQPEQVQKFEPQEIQPEEEQQKELEKEFQQESLIDAWKKV